MKIGKVSKLELKQKFKIQEKSWQIPILQGNFRLVKKIPENGNFPNFQGHF